MTYVARKTRMFRDAGDSVPAAQKRSESRMKTYPSATDARAWTTEREERRQHILELIKTKSAGLALGKYIPLEVLIDTLLANKNDEIERLKKQLEDLQKLLDMYEQLDLTPEQRAKIDKLKKSMSKAGGDLDTIARSGKSGKSGTESDIGESTTTSSPRVEDLIQSSVAPADLSSTPSTPGRSSEEARKARRRAEGEDGEEGLRMGGFDDDDESYEECMRREAEEARRREGECGANRARPPPCDTDVKGTRSEPATGTRMGTGPGTGQGPGMGSKDADVISLQNALAAMQNERDQQRELALSAIEQLENLKAIIEERDDLKQKLNASKEELQTLKGQQSQRVHAAASGTSPEGGNASIDELKQRLEQMKTERDRLQARVDELEKELEKHGTLPEEIEVFKQRSLILDDVLKEREDLYCRLAQMQGLEDEARELKKKADRVDELERLLAGMEGKNGDLKSDNNCKCREIDDLKAERDSLRRKVNEAGDKDQEMERLRYRAKESEVLRIERDRMKVRLDELSNIENEFMELLDKTKSFEQIRAERDMYKCRYEQLMGLECELEMLRGQVEQARSLEQEREALQRQVRDCECCIADQENEINRLVDQVECLAQGRDEQQDRMKQALGDMRAEIEKKNRVIGSSEEQLAHVQDNLKNTISDVSFETSQLKGKLEKLENELANAETKLKQKQDEISFLHDHIREKDDLIHNLTEDRKKSISLADHCKCKDELINKLKRALEETKKENAKLQDVASRMATVTNDEHLENMLEQSKTAVKRVAEELGKKYEETKKSKPKKQEDEQADLFDKYSKEKRNCTQLAAEVKVLRTKVQKLEDDASKSSKTITKLKDGSIGSERMLAENKTLRRISSEVQEVAKEQIQELVGQLRKANDRIAELETENQKLRSRCASGVRSLEKDTKTEPTENMDVVRQQQKELVEQLRKANYKIEDLEEKGIKDQEDMMRKLKKAENQIDELRTDNAGLLNDLRAAEEVRQQLNKAQCKLCSLTNENEQLQSDLDEETKSSKIKIDGLNRELDEVKINLRKAQAKICGMSAELDDLRDQASGRGVGDPSESEAKIRELKKEVASLRAQLEENEDMTKRITRQGSSKLDTIGKQKSRLEERLDQAEKRVSELEDENDALRRQLGLSPTAPVKRSGCGSKKKKGDDEETQRALFSLDEATPQASFTAPGEATQRAILPEEEAAPQAFTATPRALIPEKEPTPPTVFPGEKPTKDETDDLLNQLEEERRKRKEAEKRIRELEDTIEDMKMAAGGDSVEAEELMKQNAKLKKQVKELEAEIENLKDQLDSKGKTGSDQEKDLENKLNKLRSELQEKANVDAANTQLEMANAELKRQLDALKSATGKDTDTSAELLALKAEKEKLLKEIAKQKDDINDLLEKSQTVSSSDKERAAALEKERNEKKALEEMIKNLENNLSNMSKSADAKPAGDAKMQSVIDELERRLKEEQKKAEAAESAYKTLQQSAASADTGTKQVQEGTSKESQLQEQISKLQQEIASLKAQLEKANAELKAAKDLLDQKAEEVKNMSQLYEAQKKEDMGKKEDSGKKTDDTAAGQANEEKVKALQDQLKALQNEMKLLQDENKSLKDSNKALQDELAAMQNQLKSLKGDTVKDDTVKVDTTKPLQDDNKLNDENKSLKEENESLKDQIKVLQDQLITLKDQIMVLQEENENLKKGSGDYDQIKALEDQLKKQKDDFNKTIAGLQDDLKKQKQECNETIAALKGQHERNIKDVHSKYKNGVNKLQGSHEEILGDATKAHEKELEGLREELRKCKAKCNDLENENEKLKKGQDDNRRASLSVKTQEAASIEPKKDKACLCGHDPKLEGLLEKILKDGMETLEFEDLQYMHTKICDATANVLNKTGTGPNVKPNETDRYMMMRRNASLEKDLMGKQKQAQSTVGKLEMEINLERKRLEELRQLLNVEKQTNDDLISRLRAQTKAVSNMQVERDLLRKKNSIHDEKMQRYIVAVERERSKVKKLEDDLNKEKVNVTRLKDILDMERDTSRSMRKKDNDRLENLRMELDKSLSSEMGLRMQLEETFQERKRPSPCPKCSGGQKKPGNNPSNTFYTELKVDNANKQQNHKPCCQLMRREMQQQRPSREYE